MEICGRFHHWMPIVLYIMKRDAFFIWVTHFIHYDKNTGEFTNLSNMSYSEASRVVLNSSLFDYKLGL
jgi:heme/copper-type cytochrome/quinol oxidase subunit 2